MVDGDRMNLAMIINDRNMVMKSSASRTSRVIMGALGTAALFTTSILLDQFSMGGMRFAGTALSLRTTDRLDRTPRRHRLHPALVRERGSAHRWRCGCAAALVDDERLRSRARIGRTNTDRNHRNRGLTPAGGPFRNSCPAGS